MVRDTTKKVDLTLEALDDLRFTVSHEFYLGGSHFFGCDRPDSDLDFIAENTERVAAWLEGKGFKRMGDPSYKSDNGVYEKGKVQVSLHEHLKAKLIARDILSKYFAKEHKDADKATRTIVWSSLIATVAEVENTFAENDSNLPF